MKIELLPIDLERIENIKKLLESEASTEMIVTCALIVWEKKILKERSP
ncbi:hypothetical protein [Cohnella cellulosilytica]|uniref:Uncharacterized protein n=1 Tax=Cohnella cellulosilytica TaxID=986710 RepID=A0ABW2FKE0_9BACL